MLKQVGVVAHGARAIYACGPTGRNPIRWAAEGDPQNSTWWIGPQGRSTSPTHMARSRADAPPDDACVAALSMPSTRHAVDPSGARVPRAVCIWGVQSDRESWGGASRDPCPDRRRGNVPAEARHEWTSHPRPLCYCRTPPRKRAVVAAPVGGARADLGCYHDVHPDRRPLGSHGRVLE